MAYTKAERAYVRSLLARQCALDSDLTAHVAACDAYDNQIRQAKPADKDFEWIRNGDVLKPQARPNLALTRPDPTGKRVKAFLKRPPQSEVYGATLSVPIHVRVPESKPTVHKTGSKLGPLPDVKINLDPDHWDRYWHAQRSTILDVMRDVQKALRAV